LQIFRKRHYDGMRIAITLSKPGKMNKKITVAVIAGITAGIAIYLISKRIKEKNAYKRSDKRRAPKPNKAYAFEYTL